MEITLGTSLEDLGPSQSPNTTDQRENRRDFELREWDNNELTGGNLKMLNKSLKALTQGGRVRDDEAEAHEEEMATDIRPIMIQASNLLVCLIHQLTEIIRIGTRIKKFKLLKIKFA